VCSSSDEKHDALRLLNHRRYSEPILRGSRELLRDTVEDTATLLGELASIFVGYLADGDIGVVVGHRKTRNVAHAGRVAMET
jgi:hypothetical protein